VRYRRNRRFSSFIGRRPFFCNCRPAGQVDVSFDALARGSTLSSSTRLELFSPPPFQTFHNPENEDSFPRIIVRLFLFRVSSRFAWTFSNVPPFRPIPFSFSYSSESFVIGRSFADSLKPEFVDSSRGTPLRHTGPPGGTVSPPCLSHSDAAPPAWRVFEPRYM